MTVCDKLYELGIIAPHGNENMYHLVIQNKKLLPVPVQKKLPAIWLSSDNDTTLHIVDGDYVNTYEGVSSVEDFFAIIQDLTIPCVFTERQDMKEICYANYKTQYLETVLSIRYTIFFNVQHDTKQIFLDTQETTVEYVCHAIREKQLTETSDTLHNTICVRNNLATE